MHPSGGVSGMSNREKTQGHTQDMLERLHLWLRNSPVSSQRTCWKWRWVFLQQLLPLGPGPQTNSCKGGGRSAAPSISSFRWHIWRWTHQTAAPFLQQTCQTVPTPLQLRTCCKQTKLSYTHGSRAVSRLNLGSVCYLNLPSIIQVLDFGPVQCWDCIIAWLPESSLNRHFLSLRAMINQPFTHPSTQHFCHQYTSLPPSTGALGPSQTHEYNQCKPQLFATPVLLSFSLFFLVVDWGPHCNKALNKFRAPRRLSGSGRCLQLQCYWDPSPVITHKAFFPACSEKSLRLHMNHMKWWKSAFV